LTTSFSVTGSHIITAVYKGDANFTTGKLQCRRGPKARTKGGRGGLFDSREFAFSLKSELVRGAVC